MFYSIGDLGEKVGGTGLWSCIEACVAS